MNAVEKLKGQITILEEVSSYVKLKKSGILYWGLCPFHRERTPSFSVYEEKGFFHCFGCGSHGDLFNFVQNYHNISFSESIDFLSKKYNIKVKKNYQWILEEDILKQCNEIYRNNLSEKHFNYLKKRNLKDETIDFFQLGYAKDSTSVEKLMSKGYSLENIKSSGIVSYGYQDRMRNRITFPLINRNNKIIGFSGRSQEEMPKYLNFSDTSLFQKSFFLFNENNIIPHEDLIIVEGYMDVISLWQGGIKNVVACMGTSLAVTQILNVAKSCSRIFIMFDGDGPGKSAIKKNLRVFLSLISPKIEIFICNLEKKDPDWIMQHYGIDFILQTKEKALSLFDWILKNEISSHNHPQELSKTFEQIQSILNQISHKSTRKSYEFYFKSLVFKKREKLPKFRMENHKQPTMEEKIISILIYQPQFIDKYIEELMKVSFKSEFLEKIRIFITDSMVDKQITTEEIVRKIGEKFNFNYENIISCQHLYYIIHNVDFLEKYLLDMLIHVNRYSNKSEEKEYE